MSSYELQEAERKAELLHRAKQVEEEAAQVREHNRTVKENPIAAANQSQDFFGLEDDMQQWAENLRRLAHRLFPD